MSRAYDANCFTSYFCYCLNYDSRESEPEFYCSTNYSLLTTYCPLLNLVSNRHIAHNLVFSDRNLRSNRDITSSAVCFCRHGLRVYRIVSAITVRNNSDQLNPERLREFRCFLARLGNCFVARLFHKLIALVKIKRKSRHIRNANLSYTTQNL